MQDLAALLSAQQDVVGRSALLDEVLQQIAGHAQNITEAAGAEIKLLLEGELLCRARTGLQVRLENRISQQSLRTGSLLRCDDTFATQRSEFALCRQLGIRSVLVVPIFEQHKPSGVLEVFASRASAFDERDAQTLQLMTGWIASAVSESAALENRNLIAKERALFPQVVQKISSLTPRPSVRAAIAAQVPPPIVKSTPLAEAPAVPPRAPILAPPPRRLYTTVAAVLFAIAVLGGAGFLKYREVRNSAQMRTQLGAQLIAQGKLDAAVSELSGAVRQNPKDARAHYELGAAQFRLGKFEDAAASFRETLRLQPTYPHAHSGLGVALLRSNKDDEAIEQFYQAIRDDPSDADSHYHLGLLLVAKDMLPDATAEYQQALRIDPSFASAHQALAVAIWAAGSRSKSRQKAKQDFAEAWREVHTAQGLGGQVDPFFLSALQEKMPDPGQ
jgi:cytochrome c-type biogenesis protein CcmH/NrfG